MSGISAASRDHGGRLDAAAAEFGGTRADWLDLSTGIAPFAYPLPDLPAHAWTDLPDKGDFDALIAAACAFWKVPVGMDVLPVPGASLAIAQIPRLAPAGRVRIAQATYNEHEAAFRQEGWVIVREGPCEATVFVRPNNPDGDMALDPDAAGALSVVDESFGDVCPSDSVVPLLGAHPNLLVIKSFGKFWGLAGLRLGFVIGAPDMVERLRQWIGPWSVSGPALQIGAAALRDPGWANAQRARLAAQSAALGAVVTPDHAKLVGGTTLFRLYRCKDAEELYKRLAEHHILSRTFPYDPTWLRLGIPDVAGLERVRAAL